MIRFALVTISLLLHLEPAISDAIHGAGTRDLQEIALAVVNDTSFVDTSCAKDSTLICENGSVCQLDFTGNETCVFLDIALTSFIDTNTSFIDTSCAKNSTLVCENGSVCQVDFTGNETCVFLDIAFTSFLDTSCAMNSTLVCENGSFCQVDSTGNETCVVSDFVFFNSTCPVDSTLDCGKGGTCQIDFSSGNETCVYFRDFFPFEDIRFKGSTIIPCDNSSTVQCDTGSNCQIDLSGNETCVPDDSPIFHILYYARGGVPLPSIDSNITFCEGNTTSLCGAGTSCQIDAVSGNATCVLYPFDVFFPIPIVYDTGFFGGFLSCANTTICEKGFTCRVNGTGHDECIADDQLFLYDLPPVPTLYAYDFSTIGISCSNTSSLVCSPGTFCQADGLGNETCVDQFPVYYSYAPDFTLDPQILQSVGGPVGVDGGFIDGFFPGFKPCDNGTSLVCSDGQVCQVDTFGNETCTFPVFFSPGGFPEFNFTAVNCTVGGGIECPLLALPVALPDSSTTVEPPIVIATLPATTTSVPDTPTITEGGDPVWWPQVKKYFKGDNLKKCRKRSSMKPNGAMCSSKKKKTCFFGNQECPNGVGPSPKTRCYCDNDTRTWTCVDAVCPASLTDGY